MKMYEREWKIRLDSCAQVMEPDAVKKEAALLQIRNRALQKDLKYHPGWQEMISVQLLSVSVNTWLLQGLFLLLLLFSEGIWADRANISGWKIFPLLSVCMSFGAVLFVSELSRHFSCRMAELEQSCYLNLSRLWLMRVCCISGLDMLFVTALGILRAPCYGYGWFAFTVYVLTPFFLANAGMLSFFSMRRNNNKWGCAGIVLGSAAVFCTEFFCRWIYEAMWLPVWIFLLAAAMLICAAQMKKIGKKMEGEGLCWN